MIYVCYQHKGGSGKTTTVANLAGALAMAGKKVLCVDGDAQANLTVSLGHKDPEDLEGSIYNLFWGEVNVKDIIRETAVENVHLINSSEDLYAIDMDIYRNPEQFPINTAQSILKNALEAVKGEYDYVLIDTPPSINIVTINALAAADYVLPVLQTEYLATKGMKKLLETIEEIKQLNPDLKIAGVIGTMFDKRTIMATSVMQDARKYFDRLDVKVYDTVIPRTIRFGEAPAHGKPAVCYDNSPAVQDYVALAQEVFNIG